MLCVFSVFMIFLLVFLLVALVHLFVWNLDINMFGGVRSWVSSFECGFLSQRVVENYFSYTYFILLVFFVVFDLEVSLLLNMPLQGLLYKNLLFYVGFLFVLVVGFGIEISKGYVRWSY
uniref:NADH-ubiquinone oxidoreductase chain 3 n=1 Tax=Echinochasmus japonicus TaxID=1197313 RepID=A0A186QDJ7_9TREM|nr:NADH dehydrogenase subunit 3 [Echinochasmus japonicus]AKL39063.1 NADH dehydrogenase subunit 3 [Echinochasmus japonicus]